jgi:Secretion system C-terminal sorting domain
MIKQVTFILIVSVFTQLKAQIPTHFAPIGTRWTFNYYLFGQEYGEYIYESKGDTLVNGVTHRIVQGTRTVKCDYPSCVVYQTSIFKDLYTVRNDSLLLFKQNGHAFLFNFAYKIGDTVKSFAGYNRSVIVTRVADTLINSKRLKFWEINQTCSATQSRARKVYELIGSANDGFYEFNDKCTSDPLIKSVCSVKSGDWLYNPSNCPVVATQETVPTETNLSIFPNPVVDQLNIDFDPINGETYAEISFYNALGSKVGHQKLDMISPPLSINVSNLPSGMYNVVLQIKGRSPAVQKFVIVR